MQNLAERFLYLRKKIGLTQAEFASKINVSRSFISQIESGIGIPGGELLLSVNLHFGVSVDWLLTGEGEMFRDKVAEVAVSQEPVPPENPNKIKQLEEKVEYLFKVVTQRPTEFQPIRDIRGEVSAQIPYYSYSVAAGRPDEPPDDDHRHLTIDKSLLKRPSKCFALRVSGESMIGAGIDDGDIIVVERTSEPPNGAIVIVDVGGGYTVKMLEVRKNGEFWLKASNPKFKSLKISPDMTAKIIGIVVLIIKQP